ncbi:MAG: MBL fold metallo-hydrolase [Proteobacteria bacterium]|nr:MBL fold metallo-hydrolase [Cystobacterineae bacterium]MCL2314156.1 MBL fold metallo-hydrolase [Pseudomonadota bacterium]
MRMKMLSAFVLCFSLSLACVTPAAKTIELSQLLPEGHMSLGEGKIWPFLDGEVQLKPVLFQGISAEEKLKVLALEVEEDDLPTSVNVYFVEWGGRRILVDAGCGNFMGPGTGQLASVLAAKGIAPESIDTVLLTHLHGDHFGGLITEGEGARFPKATVWVHETDFSFWTSPRLVNSRPEEERAGYAEQQHGVRLLLRTLGDRLKTFNSDQTILPGVQAIHAPGHTPGHTVFMFESEGKKLLVWGDLMHNLRLQTARPNVHILFDSNPGVAVATRLHWMEKAAKEGFWVAGMHLPYPGIGRFEKREGASFNFLPIVRE